MNALLLNVSGNWGHFKKVDTNNNPLTHDFITKTALIGLMGAVNGIERVEMRKLFPQLSEDLLYGVAINNPVRKESWGFTLRTVSVNLEKSPWQFEFLKQPNFTVVICLKNKRSENIFQEFFKNIANDNAAYNPTLGLANCPANLEFLSSGTMSKETQGTFTTQGFISKKHSIVFDGKFDFRIGFDRVPTFQNDDFWNLPEKYEDIAYCSGGSSITATGVFYEFNSENIKTQWYLI